MKTRITKRIVDSLTPSDGTETILWDIDLAGFGCRVRPGGAKTYFVSYRAGRGRAAPMRKLTIGRHGNPWTPEMAREEARRILADVAHGADPAAERDAAKKAETLADLAARFMAEHVSAKRKSRTGAEYARLLDKLILPALGPVKLADVTRAAVSRLHYALRGTPYQANRVLALLSKMMNLAEAWGLRPNGSNPCAHVERYAEHHRERLLSAEELARLGDAIRAYRGSPFVPAAIRLLLFTGARLNEILGLQWDWIDYQRGEARLPDSKTGRKTLHLPAPALAVLSDLPRLEGNPFVIAGQVKGARLVNLETPWRAIRAAAGLPDARLHDLRHAFASIGAAAGDSLLVLGKVLGHTQAATTQRYAHLASDPVKATAGRIAGKIADALGPTPRTSRIA